MKVKEKEADALVFRLIFPDHLFSGATARRRGTLIVKESGVLSARYCSCTAGQKTNF